MSGRDSHRQELQSPSVAAIRVWSSDFPDNGPMPRVHTCQGDEMSPALSWEPGPEGTRSYCLIVTDPDAPIPKVTITHWILYNIPATVTSLPRGVTADQLRADQILQGRRFAGRHDYLAPCPPTGQHRYVFRVHALDTRIEIAPIAASRRRIMNAMEGHVIGVGETVGLYSRR